MKIRETRFSAATCKKGSLNSKPESARVAALSGLEIASLKLLPAMVMMMVVMMVVAFRVR